MRKFLIWFLAFTILVTAAKFSSSVISNYLFVQISSPANGAIVGGIVPVVAEATASAGVANVNFYVDGGLMVSDSASPYQFNWNTNGLVPGSYHNLSAVVTDTLNEATSSAVVSVQVQLDTTAPSVAVTNPSNGMLVRRGSVVAIQVNASDNYQMDRVEFYVNGSLRCTDSAAPYSCNWTVPGGKKGVSYSLLARANDVFGNNSNASVLVTSN